MRNELSAFNLRKVGGPHTRLVKTANGKELCIYGNSAPKVRQRLYDEFNIEIGAGLGPLKGRVWRVGLMGHGARVENVELLAKALVRLL